MNWTNWPKIAQVRDLSIIELNNHQKLVVACDSAGAIGAKELDELKCSNYILGRFTARVALLEVLAAGAMPILISDGLAVEMEPSGREILQGITDELKTLGIADKCHLTGSTEENFITKQSGIGITVIGLAAAEDLRLGKVQSGDDIYCFGLPKVGAQVNLDDPEIIDLHTVRKLSLYPEVHEIVPVGSKGILYEAQLLAKSYDRKLHLDPNCPLPLAKSAGPATCLIAAVEPKLKETLDQEFSLPVTYIGRIE